MTTESMPEDDVRMDMRTLLGAIFSRWLRIIAVTLILVAIAYAVLMFVPKVYESQSSILVEPRQNAFTQPTSGQTATTGTVTAEAAVSSQIELIKSRDTLLTVVDQLKLRDVPEFNGEGDANLLGAIFQVLGRRAAPDTTDQTVLTNLLGALTVLRERDSAIISIFARSRDPKLASDIANAVAAAHVQRRADLSLQDTAEASVWLEQEIVKLRERVNAAETAVADFKIQNGLITGANNTSLVDQRLSNISTQITNAQERRSTAQSRAALIRSLLDAGQPIDGLPDVQASAVIQQLSQTMATLQSELAQREATLLPNHPTVRALNAQIRELREQIAIEASRVVRALEVEAQIESDLVISLQDELARTTVTASDATSSTVQLDELQREATAQRSLLESYLLRYRDAIARSDSSSALPDVRVITGAAPAVSPASPKVSLILAAVAFVALALQVGGIIFGELMTGRALVTRAEDIDEEYQPTAAYRPTGGELQPVLNNERTVSVDEPTTIDDIVAASHADTAADAAVVAQLAPAPEPDPWLDPVPATATAPTTAAAEPAPETPVGESAAVPAKSKGKKKKAVTSANAAEVAAPLLAPTYEGRAQKSMEVSNLSADLALGRSRVVMLAGLSSNKDVVAMADRLVADALHNGLSIARVDAGSGDVSAEPGITDLAAELASFGDVVHRGARDGLAEVPWGQQQTLDRDSAKPVTLLEALTDIYEAVIVMTGPVGRTSALTSFSGADCRMVVVGDERAEADKIEAALSEAAALGYHPVQFMVAPIHHAEVA